MLHSRYQSLLEEHKTRIALVPMGSPTQNKIIMYVQVRDVAYPVEYVLTHSYTEISLYTPGWDDEYYFFDHTEPEYIQASQSLLDCWYMGVPEQVRKTCAYLINLYRTNLYQYLSFIKTVEKLGQINLNVR